MGTKLIIPHLGKRFKIYTRNPKIKKKNWKKSMPRINIKKAFMINFRTRTKIASIKSPTKVFEIILKK